jgi:N-acetylglucosamine kinase-like BadF-type ATPase
MNHQTAPGLDYIIGVDGGGSKTLALAAGLDGTILGQGTAGPSNPHARKAEDAFAALEAAILSAQAASGQGLAPRAVCIGLAGVDSQEDIDQVLAWWKDRFPGIRLQVVNDAWLALAAGTPAGVGAAIISGTGSISVARGLNGQTGRSGGQGFLFGDEGSGYAVGLAALRSVAQAADGRGPATLLTELVLAHFGMQNPAELIGKIYALKSPRTDLARLAIHVQAAAGRGDPAALKILGQAGADLAAAAVAAAHQVGLDGPTPVAAAGGLMVHWPALQESFKKFAARAGIEPDPFTVVEVPAIGAIRLALQILA